MPNFILTFRASVLFEKCPYSVTTFGSLLMGACGEIADVGCDVSDVGEGFGSVHCLLSEGRVFVDLFGDEVQPIYHKGLKVAPNLMCGHPIWAYEEEVSAEDLPSVPLEDVEVCCEPTIA